MAQRSDLSKQIRENIQASLEIAEREQKKELFRRRLELARSGVSFMNGKNFPEAVKAFLSYLKILEEWKQVPEHGLNPTHFDLRVDKAEILLISGIYWDLTKLYDRTKSPEKYKLMKVYLTKYVVFSKGMPFQETAAETLRKYILVEKPKHVADFKGAYKSLAKNKCFVATELVEHLEPRTLPALRSWRDNSLRKTRLGRVFIYRYYKAGPMLALRISVWPTPIKRILAKTLDLWARLCG